jgi:hypothetical protein
MKVKKINKYADKRQHVAYQMKQMGGVTLPLKI